MGDEFQASEMQPLRCGGIDEPGEADVGELEEVGEVRMMSGGCQ